MSKDIEARQEGEEFSGSLRWKPFLVWQQDLSAGRRRATPQPQAKGHDGQERGLASSRRQKY